MLGDEHRYLGVKIRIRSWSRSIECRAKVEKAMRDVDAVTSETVWKQATELEILDLPASLDSDTDARFLAA